MSGSDREVNFIKAFSIIKIISPKWGLFDYENKYNGKTQEICSDNISDELKKRDAKPCITSI